MSLKPLQPNGNPLGQFDVLDGDLLNIKGGEVVTFGFVSSPNPPGTDLAAADAFDGYTNTTTTTSGQKRPVVTKTIAATSRPLMLADDGITGYGTLFGAVVGGTVGQQVNGPNTYTGAILGPHTATGSGKMTCWAAAGLYAVSLDAVDTTSNNGLQPTNTGLDTGAALYVTAAGLLTPTVGSSAGAGTLCARFVDFTTNGALVTTPNSLVAALNSPSGNVTSVGPRKFAFATFYFNPPIG